MPALEFIVSLFGGVAALTLLAIWRYSIHRKRDRQNLASSIIGELVGFLRIIETSHVEERLLETKRNGRVGRTMALSLLADLPQPVIFQANAKRLNLLAPALARMLPNFYALMAGISTEAKHFNGGKGEAALVASQLREALIEADDIMRSLRPLL